MEKDFFDVFPSLKVNGNAGVIGLRDSKDKELERFGKVDHRE